ncbi:hypothetical protein ANCDUO_25497 [Ancylostoma duodenale]|uniref:Uncharacterized protein n=1 Tax=Ancylostoma duodenale TaxID=51022 RepID=A0A0C2C496_9BILA|nr:hypothetical protein ANCDUO_25497 [Ancylostoma duodenale]
MREEAKLLLRYSDSFSVGSLSLAIFGVHTLARVTSNKLSQYCFMTENATFVWNFVTICEMFVLSLVASLLLASLRNAMFGSYRLLKTQSSLRNTEESELGDHEIGIEFSSNDLGSFVVVLTIAFAPYLAFLHLTPFLLML